MGLTTEGNKRSPVQVVPKIAAVDIASGSDHLVILTQNGHVYTLGCGEQGQLGRVTSRTLTGESRRGKTSLLMPGVVPYKAKNFVANAIWTTPFCTFIRENSTSNVYGFGLNNYNQLGVKKGGQEFEHFPLLSKFNNVKSISGGQHHTIVLANDNKVHAIGRKDYGRLGLGEVADHVAELTLIESLSRHDIVKVSCGESNSFALSKDGKVYVWGMGTSSQLGTGDEEDVPEPKLLVSAQVKDKNLFSMSSGGQHSLFLVESPESVAAPVKVKVSEKSTTAIINTNSEAASKQNGKAAGRGTSKKQAEAPVIMESDSTTDVNGNSEKDEKMEVDSTANKRAKKRKAVA